MHTVSAEDVLQPGLGSTEAIESAQNDHANVVQNMLDNKAPSYWYLAGVESSSWSRNECSRCRPSNCWHPPVTLLLGWVENGCRRRPPKRILLSVWWKITMQGTGTVIVWMWHSCVPNHSIAQCGHRRYQWSSCRVCMFPCPLFLQQSVVFLGSSNTLPAYRSRIYKNCESFSANWAMSSLTTGHEVGACLAEFMSTWSTSSWVTNLFVSVVLL